MVLGWGVTIGDGNNMKIGLIYTLIQINFVLMFIKADFGLGFLLLAFLYEL